MKIEIVQLKYMPYRNQLHKSIVTKLFFWKFELLNYFLHSYESIQITELFLFHRVESSSWKWLSIQKCLVQK